MRTVIVTGGRDWPDERMVWDALYKSNPALVVQGGCPTGADFYAREWATLWRVPCETVRANWAKEGASAGPRRNQRMLKKHPQALVLAFPHGGHGTADCMRRAKKLGMQVEVVELFPTMATR